MIRAQECALISHTDPFFKMIVELKVTTPENAVKR